MPCARRIERSARKGSVEPFPAWLQRPPAGGAEDQEERSTRPALETSAGVGSWPSRMMGWPLTKDQWMPAVREM